MRLGRIKLVALRLRRIAPQRGSAPMALTHFIRSLLPRKRGGHRFSPTPPSVRFSSTKLVRLGRIERPTTGLEGRCSIHLSYRRI